MEEETKLENVKVSDIFVEEKKVKEITVSDETPMGDAVFGISFEEGDDMTLTTKKFECIKTDEKSDATTARNTLAKKVGSDIYAILMEYGIRFSEIDPVLNEVVRLANDGQNLASDTLWGNKAYDRSLIDVNRVLLNKYAEPEKTDLESNSVDAPASDGSTVDSENKD